VTRAIRWVRTHWTFTFTIVASIVVALLWYASTPGSPSACDGPNDFGTICWPGDPVPWKTGSYALDAIELAVGLYLLIALFVITTSALLSTGRPRSGS
jgi:hypothetical protein